MDKNKYFGISRFVEGRQLNADSKIGRIIKQTNHTFTVATMDGVLEQVKQKRIKKEKKKNSFNNTFVVGDFIIIEKVKEHYFLVKYFERNNIVSKAESKSKKSFREQTVEQIMAANIDHVFITISADQRFTLSKIERYILTFTIPNANLDILITKADYKEQAHYLIKQIEASDFNEEVYNISIYDQTTINQIKNKMTENSTSILLGASGAGKPTLINKIIGENEEKTGAVRSDGKGKHTTTYSSLVPIPGRHAYIIDTPGIKSISTTKEIKNKTFDDILDLSKNCKFRNCNHDTEPYCAVKQAVENGSLSREKLERYHKYN